MSAATGQGRPTLTWLPGWGCDGDLFTEVLDALPEADHVVVDLGPGTSRAQMVEAALDQLPERTHLVGVSMGGWVAQEVVARAPERIGSLVLACTWGAPPPTFPVALEASIELVDGGTWGAGLRPYLLANFSPACQGGPLPDRLLAMIERVGRDRLQAQARVMLADPDVTAWHDRVPCPTLVLAADGDVFFGVGTPEAVAASIGSRSGVPTAFEVVAGSNHNVTWEQPAAVTAAVARWCLSAPG